MMRPIVKWAGGKSRLLRHLQARMPERFGRYIEPCLGGGALAFSLPGRPMLLSDANHELMLTYACVRAHCEEVVSELCQHVDSPAHYYALRAVNPTSLPDTARAARFLYLNRTGFNGLYRVNRAGHFNVPYGRPARGGRVICDAAHLHAAATHLRNATLMCGDVFEVAAFAQRGDFVYLDPPYARTSPTSFDAYTPGGFGLPEHARLAELAFALQRRGVHVLVSNADTPEIRSLYPHARMEQVHCPRSINAQAGGRGAVPELLLSLRPAPSRRRSSQSGPGAPARRGLRRDVSSLVTAEAQALTRQPEEKRA